MGKKFDLSDFEHSVVEWCDGHTTISISYRECLWNIHERMFFLLSLDIPINVWGKKKKIVLACFPDLQISEKIIPTTVVFLMDNKNNA